jgi:hypothetical protein
MDFFGPELVKYKFFQFQSKNRVLLVQYGSDRKPELLGSLSMLVSLDKCLIRVSLFGHTN